ncbi:hypothetical protein ASE04_19035 [Rhizobium sp. Root708]|uniref:hypothetical protein n=1 Tax=Rhizobium sp. Root708 TaxID=1736592 RepID=UPI0006F7E4D7|nr:hypothetical protein [Rhizobium sp. Root708]KRB49264.1 hypothetical protein ASE04_19035 [Rhizobium sp. Root708]
MQGDRPFERRRALRGVAYSLAEFQEKYRLSRSTAEDLFFRFGPSAIELDILMSAKKHTPTIHSITRDLSIR